MTRWTDVLVVLALSASLLAPAGAVTDKQHAQALKKLEKLEKKLAALQKTVEEKELAAQTTLIPDSVKSSHLLPNLTKLDDGYYLAFRATSGVGQSAYDKYLTPGDDDTLQAMSVMPCGCLTVDGSESCDRHYKSRIITLWGLMEIDKVRVSIYSRGKEKAYLEFTGKKTTSTDFFSSENLKSSTYGNKLTDFNHFSIKGHVNRHFFVNRRYANQCAKDEGWFVVLDGAHQGEDNCPWAKHKAYPVFLYSSGPGTAVWADHDAKEGDVFVVAVKLAKNFNPNSVANTGQCLDL